MISYDPSYRTLRKPCFLCLVVCISQNSLPLQFYLFNSKPLMDIILPRVELSQGKKKKVKFIAQIVMANSLVRSLTYHWTLLGSLTNESASYQKINTACEFLWIIKDVYLAPDQSDRFTVLRKTKLCAFTVLPFLTLYGSNATWWTIFAMLFFPCIAPHR